MTSASQDNHDFEAVDRLPQPFQLAVETILVEPTPDIDLTRLVPRGYAPTALASDRRHWLMRVGGWSFAAVATVLVLLTGVIALRPASAWAQVAEAVRKQAWVRLTSASPDGKDRGEIWFSPTKKLAAAKFPGFASSFLDLNRDDCQQFNAADSVIYRSDVQSVEQDHLVMLISLFESFADGGRMDVKAGSIKLKRRASRERQVGDEQWTEHILEWEETRRLPPSLRQVFHVPAGQRLPTKMVQECKIDGKTIELKFGIDYPEIGPSDLYALNVPRDTKVIDTRSGPALKELLVEFEKQQQTPLPAYSATILATDPKSDWKDIHEAYYIHGNGPTLTIQNAYLGKLLELRQEVWKKNLQIPDGADKLAWWKAEIGNLPFEQSEMTQAVFIPGQSGYPLIGLPSQARRATLELKPAFGPSNCPRVTVDDPKTGEKRDVYWFDPSRGHMIVRWENYHRQKPSDWINTDVVDAAEQAPNGRWYATQVRHGQVQHSGDELPLERNGGPVMTMIFRLFVEFEKP